MTLQQCLKTSVADMVPNTQTTVRSALLTSIQPLVQYKLFLNPVVDDYPDLRQQYLAVVKEPMSLSVIKYRLNAKTCKYSIVFEALHDLCLLTHNCRLFNPSNEFLAKECSNFEAVLLQSVNSFLFKLNVRAVPTYAELAQQALQSLQQVLEAAPQGGESQQQPRDRGAPTQEAVDEITNILQALPQEKQHKLLQMLAFEMDLQWSQEGAAVLQFDLDRNPAQFWWFYEQALQESKAGEETEDSDTE